MENNEKELVYSWKIHPASIRPVQAGFVFLFILFTIALVYISFREFFYAGLAFVILLFSLSTYFFPTNYMVYQDEIIAKYPFSTRKESISKFRNIIEDRNGLLLSPVKNHKLVHEIRSFFLIVPKNLREELKPVLERLMAENEISESVKKKKKKKK